MPCRTALRSALLVFAFTIPAVADPVPVVHVQGTMHGFLTIHSQSGAFLGTGEFTQTGVGDRFTTHAVLRFRDGSIDDEIAVFLQRKNFEFVSDHHIQKGPFFKQQVDSLIEANGQVTMRITGSDGKTKQDTTHIDLPPDLANGISCPLFTNLPLNAGWTLGMIVPLMGKGHIIKLNVTPDGTAPFTAVTGLHRIANRFRVKLDLGGIAGVIAPILGKKPADIIVWVLEGDAPVIVRQDAQLADGVPVVSIELAGASFPGGPAANAPGAKKWP